MAKRQPGSFDSFRGLWARGSIDKTPSDHFSASLNNTFIDGVCSRDGSIEYNATTGIVRMHLYKPHPPFTGTNFPRIIALKSNGDLIDLILGTTLYSNALMLDFGFVNFFGRCYISPSDGKVGLENVNLKLYDGTTFRDAGGARPTVPLTANTHVPLGGGKFDWVGNLLLSYAFETSSGFITKPAPFIAIESYGETYADITNIPIGPAGTAARWIIGTKGLPFELLGPLGGPYDVTDDSVQRFPIYFALRIGDNTTTSYTPFSYYEGSLVESADYLWTIMETIPAGVGLLDYKGKLVSYGEFDDPSIVRVSQIGEPESFSATSGFFITDPSDSTGVRSATEFRSSLFVFKSQRGYVTDDNQFEASTWNVTNFEKSIGTQQYGIASVLDAKGSSAEGYIIADIGSLRYFNGTFVEPELSYKIRDLWLRINNNFFHKVQVANDPINRRLYILVPLDTAETVSHIIYGDYRDGLDAMNIKWDIWEFTDDPTSILIYTDFTLDVPSLVTRISNSDRILTLNVGEQGNDNGEAIDSYFSLAPVRFTRGISQFNRVRISASGPCRLAITAHGLDNIISVQLPDLSINTALPGREYTQIMNLVNEQCILKIRCNVLNQFYKVDAVDLEGQPLWDERAR